MRKSPQKSVSSAIEMKLFSATIMELSRTKYIIVILVTLEIIHRLIYLHGSFYPELFYMGACLHYDSINSTILFDSIK